MTARHAASAALLLVCLLVVPGCIRVSTTPRISAEDTRHKSLSADGVRDLRLESKNGSVVVGPSDGDRIDVTFEVRGRADTRARARELVRETKSVATQKGDTLVIETRLPKGRRGREDISCSYEIKMPKEIGLSVRTSNGSIEVEDRSAECDLSTSNGSIDCARLTGKLAASTSNGRIRLQDTRAEIDASTSNGSITGSGLYLGDSQAMFRTSNGTIKLFGVHGSLDASTSNGKLSVDFAELGPDDIRLVTSNGSVDLGLPESVQASVSASTSNGSVDSSYPFESSSISRAGSRSIGEFSTANPENRISITTSNASIHIGPSD